MNKYEYNTECCVGRILDGKVILSLAIINEAPCHEDI